MLPQIQEVEERGTISSDAATALFGVGCTLVLLGICVYDYFYGSL